MTGHRDTIHCPGSLFTFGHRLHSLPRGQGQPPKPLADFGLREGLEVRSAVYFAVTLALVYVLRHAPIVKIGAGVLWWPLAYITVPGLVAWRLTVAEPSGRPVRRWLVTLVLHTVTPSQRSAGRTISAEGVAHHDPSLTAVASSSHDPRLRECVIHGPATVGFGEVVYFDERSRGRGRITRPRRPGGYGKGRRVNPDDRVYLDPGDRLVVSP